jgi:hypothetical protein
VFIELGIPQLKLGILLLWASWLSLVTLLNIMDVLRHSGLISKTTIFSSTNFEYIVVTTAKYKTPMWVNWLLFIGVIIWELIASFLLWRALFLGAVLPAVNAAFVVSLALWGMFILVDEFFLTFIVEGEGSYSISATHRSIFTSFLVSLLAIHLL